MQIILSNPGAFFGKENYFYHFILVLAVMHQACDNELLYCVRNVATSRERNVEVTLLSAQECRW